MKTDLAVELLQIALDTVLGRRHFDGWLGQLVEFELRERSDVIGGGLREAKRCDCV